MAEKWRRPPHSLPTKQQAAAQGDYTEQELDAAAYALNAIFARSDAASSEATHVGNGKGATAWGIEQDRECTAALVDAVGAMTKRLDEFMTSHGKRLDAIEAAAKKAAAADDDDDADPDDPDADPGEGKGEPEPMASDDNRRRDARKDSDVQLQQMAAVQYRADELSVKLGMDRAPRPMDGESLRSFELRQARRFQRFSPAYAHLDLSTLRDRTTRRLAFDNIYAEAEKRIGDASFAPPGTLREIKRQDQSGRWISEFVGDVSVTLAPFKMPSMRVKRFNKNPDRINSIDY